MKFFLPFTQYSELLIELTKREIKSRYKQSILGYAWVILNPFFQIVVMAFVFSHIMRVQSLTIPYEVFLYVGLLPWILFSNSIGSSVNALVGNSSLITKIYFPREVFILSTLIAKVVDFLLASIILLLLMMIHRLPITIHVLWFIPIFCIQQIFTYGLSLIVAALNLFYRDIQYVMGLVLMLWMYLTPVIYPIEVMPDKYRWVFQLNPMAVIINAYRQTILGGGMPNLVSLSIALALSLALLSVGFWMFKKLEGVFADVV